MYVLPSVWMFDYLTESPSDLHSFGLCSPIAPGAAILHPFHRAMDAQEGVVEQVKMLLSLSFTWHSGRNLSSAKQEMSKSCALLQARRVWDSLRYKINGLDL